MDMTTVRPAAPCAVGRCGHGVRRPRLPRSAGRDCRHHQLRTPHRAGRPRRTALPRTVNQHFASLVIGLAHQAEQALGGQLPPGADKIPGADARQMAQALIDTLAMLEQKTSGHLDDDGAQAARRGADRPPFPVRPDRSQELRWRAAPPSSCSMDSASARRPMPPSYGDVGSNTLGNVARAVGGADPAQPRGAGTGSLRIDTGGGGGGGAPARRSEWLGPAGRGRTAPPATGNSAAFPWSGPSRCTRRVSQPALLD